MVGPHFTFCIDIANLPRNRHFVRSISQRVQSGRIVKSTSTRNISVRYALPLIVMVAKQRFRSISVLLSHVVDMHVNQLSKPLLSMCRQYLGGRKGSSMLAKSNNQQTKKQHLPSNKKKHTHCRSYQFYRLVECSAVFCMCQFNNAEFYAVPCASRTILINMHTKRITKCLLSIYLSILFVCFCLE